LVDNPKLKYEWLNNFDQAMISFFRKNNVLTASIANKLNMDTLNKVMIFEKKGLVFLFNFHPVNSIPNYKFPAPQKGKYQIVLNSDDKNFGGHDRLDESIIYESFEENGSEMLQVYLPNRTAFIMVNV
jgi:1,4-alpha-glucan branching enzyme